MKRIDELGISPAPWSVIDADLICADVVADVPSADGVCTAVAEYVEPDNARLIAAAPEMYECLRDAVIEMCHDCPNCGPYPDYQCKNKACECFPNEWRKVLVKAAGEEVDDGK